MPIEFAADTGYALRLLVAAILGALIGLEREIHEHPAGMRTHLLVSLGSAGFHALRDAVASVAGYRYLPDLDAPATDERILAAVDDLKRRSETQA